MEIREKSNIFRDYIFPEKEFLEKLGLPEKGLIRVRYDLYSKSVEVIYTGQSTERIVEK